MLKEELQTILNTEYEKGIEFMKQKMLSVCNTDKPIEIDGRAYFVQSDKKNLHKIFNDNEGKSHIINEGDIICCRTESGNSYVGEFINIVKWQENDNSEPYDMVLINTSDGSGTYSYTVIKVVDIVNIHKVSKE